MHPVRPTKYSGIIDSKLFVKAQRLHVGKWRSLVIWLFPVIMTAVAPTLNPEVSVLQLAIAFPLGCLFPLAILGLRTRQWNKIHRQSPYLKEPINCTITEAGMEFVSSTASGLIRWSTFIKRKELPDLLLLYQAPNLFYIVSQSFFASAEDWQYAKELIRSQVK
jgi:Na+(H+)/acetate symporter ActP